MSRRGRIDEIEWSSRVFVEAGALYLSTPVLDGIEISHAARTTVGFVLDTRRLVTVRFAPVAAFDRLVSAYSTTSLPRAADVFSSSSRPSSITRRCFRARQRRARADLVRRLPPRAAPAHALHRLERCAARALRQLGRMEDGISHVRDMLLGIERSIAFVLDNDSDPGVAAHAARLHAIRADVVSLTDYQVHSSGKLQFLLDATRRSSDRMDRWLRRTRQIDAAGNVFVTESAVGQVLTIDAANVLTPDSL